MATQREDGHAFCTQARATHAQREAADTWNSDAGWELYFADVTECEDERESSINQLVAFFLSHPGQTRLAAIPALTFALPLDYAQLQAPGSASVLRDIALTLRSEPDEALSRLALAAARAVEILSRTDGNYPALPVARENRLLPRISNVTPLTPMRSLRAASVGSFVAIRGTVVRVSNIRQQVVSMRFSCAKCSAEQTVPFPDFKYLQPTSCSTPKCRARNFEALRESAETVDWQRVRIQEIQDRDDQQREEGRMPRTIDAELFSDLIDTCIPGDIVVICGVVRVLTLDGGGGGKNARNAKCLYYMYLEANSIANPRGASETPNAAQQPMQLETAQMGQLIGGVLDRKDVFGFLVHSAVPSIFGHEMVKAGMLLALFGGARKHRLGAAGDSESVAIRPDIHCLVVGDPGLGKSQMLKGMCRIAPRSVYVCGNTTTNAGLTVTVVREASGDFALEAGALVLGDRGICCIDEFDKMGAEHAALLEAMEQQSVSVAKAGLLCNLSARTTVIAAANPVGGHYDRSRTVCENLKMPLPLLSRFDLVFILMDKPDQDRDRFISEHIMAMFGMRDTRGALRRHAARNSTRPTQCAQLSRAPTQPTGNHIPPLASAHTPAPSRTPLRDRLRATRVVDPLPAALFRQYVSYARTHVHPELSVEARNVLQQFYLRLRRGARTQDSTPITTRQLESLIRLCEARARAEMRTTATEDDAHDVVDLMRESMLEALTDEHGTIDLGRSSGMSRAKDVRNFIAALHAEAARSRSAIFDLTALKRVATSIGIAGERLDNVIETVNYQGYMTKKRRNTWLLQSSVFSQAA